MFSPNILVLPQITVVTALSQWRPINIFRPLVWWRRRRGWQNLRLCFLFGLLLGIRVVLLLSLALVRSET